MTGEFARSDGNRKSRRYPCTCCGPPVDGDGVVSFADRVEHGSIGIELFTLLVVVRNLYVRAAAGLAGVRMKLAHQHAKQRGLARPIRSDEPDAIAAHDAKGCVLQNRTPVERFAHLVGFEHHLP